MEKVHVNIIPTIDRTKTKIVNGPKNTKDEMYNAILAETML